MLADSLLGGFPSELIPASSKVKFPDGADFRIEIPSVEVLRSVVA